MAIDEDSLSLPILQEKRGVFVTLLKNNKLRGCIGNLRGDRPVYQALIENTLAAALFDPRFSPLEENELKDLKIEISLLSEIKPIHYNDEKELLKYLQKKKPGIVIKKNLNEATFLPQVWKELKKPEEFLSQLCLKAGLGAEAWKKPGIEIFEYEVEKIQ